MANPTVMVIQHLGEKSIKTNRDIPGRAINLSREEMDGRDGTREDTQDTTRLVEIEKVKRSIFVTKLSPFVTFYSDAVTVCDKTVAGRCAQRQGGWVGGYPQMLFLPWLLWKETRGTSSTLA
jgi:hypothetical protein